MEGIWEERLVLYETLISSACSWKDERS